MSHVTFIFSVVALCLFGAIVCPPVTERPSSTAAPEAEAEKNEKLGVEYENYLKEVVSILETDENFRKKLEQSNISDIKSGEIAKHLDFVGHGIRTQLDEIKRKEVDRLRQVMRLKSYLQKGLKSSHPDLVLPEINKDRLLAHLDHSNPNTFEVADLAKLIKQATTDLEEVDKKRREEFKNYEMEKEVLRREHLKGLNETERKEEEQKHEEMQKKHIDHPKLHHPGNEEQLKEVWEESDGLNEKDFDPKTFFHLHDTNGDGFLDAGEVEALFQQELDKAYDPDAPEDDMMERYEDMNRMREHLVNEVDKNKDSLISFDEFIESTKTDEFKKDEGWEPIDQEAVYSEAELAAFQKNYEERVRLGVEPRPDEKPEHGEEQKNSLEGVAAGLGHQPLQNVVPGEHQPVVQHHPEQPVVHEQVMPDQPVPQPVHDQPAHEQPVQPPADQGEHIQQQQPMVHEQQEPQVVQFQQHQEVVQQPVGGQGEGAGL